MKFVKYVWMLGYCALTWPSKSTLTPSRFFEATALMVFVIAVCVLVDELAMPLMVASSKALMTSTTRSPARCARLIMSVSWPLCQPCQPAVDWLKLPSQVMSMAK